MSSPLEKLLPNPLNCESISDACITCEYFSVKPSFDPKYR